jgi:diaminohydroxyphosphoribosylaminopyrimidine deaminase/5-amino-6-(5-phosphoribosylamino)uracil reductase
MSDDRRHMLEALGLAAKAAGATSPNPMVGCVLVKDGAVVGRGFHKGPGQPHAEAEALGEAGAAARGAVAYVSLEPCSHFGRTPPCSDALIKAGVAEVVFAIGDPNPAASGGAARLRARGVRVRDGVCADEARRLNRFWLHALNSSRPYVVAKFAMSLDGKIATARGDSKWITGPLARERAHSLRKSVDAVIVGAGTIIADDPSLTARDGPAIVGMPLRVVMDSVGRTPLSSAVYDRAGKGALLAATRKASPSQLERYRQLGVETLVLHSDARSRPDAEELLIALKERGCSGVLVEGGAETLGSFFDRSLVDEVWAFVAPIIVGGGKAAVAGLGVDKIAGALRLNDVSVEQLGQDILMRGYKETQCSPVS